MSNNGSRSSSKTAVVVPTRNRSDLAIAAVRSILDQSVDDVVVIVSDNSTSPEDKKTLAGYCERVADSGVRYIAPPEPLAMPEHWEWAIQQALRLQDADHFIYLTDRSMFKPDALAAITEISRQNPDQVVSYDWVTVFDHLDPILVETKHETGQVIEVSTARLLTLSSESIIPNCLPRMMNCCAPRSIIEAIQNRFGNVFASTSPDYNFCYKCLEVVDSIFYYDRATFVSYAISRSNGASMIGVSTEATQDFIANLDLGGLPRSFATPLPAFETVTNYVLHEYCLVKQETGSSKFPEVDREKYLNCLASEASANQTPQLKREMKSLLKAQGYSMSINQRLSQLRGRLSLKTRARKVLRGQAPVLSAGAGPFDSVQAAIDYAFGVPLSGDPAPYHLKLLRG